MRDYQRELEAVTARLGEARPRLLLHSCCGPCSSYCLEYLTRWFRVDVLFYNPNILPEEEFHRRLYWQRRLLETAPFGRGVELLVPPRDEAAFRAAARGLEREPEGGTRCTACFRLRLERTARQAQAGGYEYFTTTLTVSPHKNAALINAIGQELAQAFPGPAWLPGDFKKRDGYKRSVQLSREYGLYRQSWCGCGWPEEERK